MKYGVTNKEIENLAAELQSLKIKQDRFISDRDQQTRERKRLQREVSILQETLMASRVDHELIKEVGKLAEEKEQVEYRIIKLEVKYQELKSKPRHSRQQSEGVESFESSSANLRDQKTSLEKYLGDALENTDLSPALYQRVESIKRQIDALDAERSTDNEQESGGKSYGEGDYSERYQKSPHYGDVSRVDNERIVCCPCFRPLNSCWVAILRGIGYSNNK